MHPDIEQWYNEVRPFIQRPILVEAVQIKKLSLNQILKEKETEIAELEYERAYVFDKQGNILFTKDGSRNEVSFTGDELALIRGRDAVFTHNHPTYGGSFSLEDVYFAMKNDLAEMRAVGKKYVHSMKRPAEGWPAVKELIDEYDRANKEVQAEFWKKIYAGQMTPEEAEREHWHEVWTRVARRLNLLYKREVRKGAGN